MQCSPTMKWQEIPNPPTKKINLSNIEYKILNKHIIYSDQCVGAVHPNLYKKDAKIMLISIMTLAYKIRHTQIERAFVRTKEYVCRRNKDESNLK